MNDDLNRKMTQALAAVFNIPTTADTGFDSNVIVADDTAWVYTESGLVIELTWAGLGWSEYSMAWTVTIESIDGVSDDPLMFEGE